MKQSSKKSSPKTTWLISGCVALVLLGGCIFLEKLLMSDLGPQRKTQISTVNLIPPPPPVVNNPQFVFNKPTWVQRPAQTPLFNDAVYMDEWPLESDPPAPDLSTGAYNNIMGMPRCTIWRHGGTTAVARTPPGHSTTPPYFTFPGSAAINIGFDDGHAQQVKLKDLWQLNWHQNWGSD